MNRKKIIFLGILLLSIVVAYGNSFQNGFHFDDFHTVVDNPAIRSLKNVPKFFTDTTTFSVLPANRTYRPVVSTMLALDYALGHGYHLFWFHLTTFLLFLLLAAMLFELYQLLLEKTEPGAATFWIALLAAAWYGLHPAMAETVNYVIQRGDLYCTLGCVAALYVFVRYPERRRYALYLVPFVLAMLSKPPAAVFPLLLLLYVYFFETAGEAEGRRWRTAGLAAVPSIAVTLALLWLQSAMTPKSYLPGIVSAADYRLTQPYVWMRYAGALFLPLHLNVDTDLNAFATLNLPALAGIVFVAGLAAAIWICARQRRLYPIAYGLLWFVITQLPTSLYPLSEVENDHRMFFSFVGLVLAVVWAAWLGVERLMSRERLSSLRPAMLGLAVVVLAAYGYGVHQRNKVWRTEESLWLDDVQKSPKNGRGLMNYALTQMGQGRYTVALDYLQRALEFTPNYPSLEINLGIVNGALADQGESARTVEAERHFLRAIALAPADDGPASYYGRWLDQHGRTAEAIRQLTTAVALNPQRLFQRDLLMQADAHAGDLEAARALAKETQAIAPDDAEAQMILGGGGGTAVPPTAALLINASLAAYNAGKYQEAIAVAQRSLALAPNSAEAYNNIAASYGALKQWGPAIESVRQALSINPNLQIAKNNLAWFLSEQHKPVADAPTTRTTADQLLNASLEAYKAGNFPASVAAAKGALQLRPNYAEAWNNIAAAEASMKHWDAAIDAANKAVALKPDFQLAKNNLAWALSEKAAGR